VSFDFLFSFSFDLKGKNFCSSPCGTSSKTDIRSTNHLPNNLNSLPETTSLESDPRITLEQVVERMLLVEVGSFHRRRRGSSVGIRGSENSVVRRARGGGDGLGHGDGVRVEGEEDKEGKEEGADRNQSFELGISRVRK